MGLDETIHGWYWCKREHFTMSTSDGSRFINVSNNHVLDHLLNIVIDWIVQGLLTHGRVKEHE